MATSQSKVINLSAAVKEDAQDFECKDYFVQKNGLTFAGTHLILDLWGAKGLTDVNFIEATLREAIDAAKATLLHIHLHSFGPNEGVSGVAVLAESHISIHTWPEREFAALDIFMCGSAEPEKAVPVLKKAFNPTHITIGEQKRGIV